MRKLIALLIPFALLALAACGAPADDPVPDRAGEPEASEADPGEAAEPISEDIVLPDATVRHLEVEGGCWVLEDTEGNRYEPVELSEEHRNDGATVSVVLRPRPDMASTCQVGRLVEIIAIEVKRFDPGVQ